MATNYVYQSTHNFIYISFEVLGTQNGWQIHKYFGDDFVKALEYYNLMKNHCEKIILIEHSKARQIQANFEPIVIL